MGAWGKPTSASQRNIIQWHPTLPHFHHTSLPIHLQWLQQILELGLENDLQLFASSLRERERGDARDQDIRAYPFLCTQKAIQAPNVGREQMEITC